MAILNRQELLDLIEVLFPDNSTGDITAADVRTYLDTIVDSNIIQQSLYATLAGSPVLPTLAAFDGNTIYVNVSGDKEIQLPPHDASYSGRAFQFLTLDDSIVTITPDGGDTIQGKEAPIRSISLVKVLGLTSGWLVAANSLQIEKTIIQNFVSIGYGGIGVDDPHAIGAVGAGWTKIEGFDLALINPPVKVGQDIPNSGLIFQEAGIWQVTVKITLTFDELNAGREMSLRISNETTGAPGAVQFVYFIGRNQAGTNLSLTLNAEIEDVNAGDLFILEIGGGDSFTAVVNIGTIYQANHISEFRGTL